MNILKLQPFTKKNILHYLSIIGTKGGNSYSLLYHLIDEQKAKSGAFSDNIHFVSTQYVYEQLSDLKRSYTFVSLEEHVAVARKNKAYKNLVSVSIDDGYKASVEKGREVFSSLDIPVTYFVNTSIIEKGVFWRDKVRYVISLQLENEFLEHARQSNNLFQQVQENDFYRITKNPDLINSKLVDVALDKFLIGRAEVNLKEMYLSVEDLKNEDYFTWGNHTDNHYVMSSLNKEEQYREIKYVEDFYKKEGIKYSDVFSIPFGSNNSFNEDTISLLADMGYKGVVLSSGYEVKRDIEFTKNFSKYNIGVINRFMPENISAIL